LYKYLSIEKKEFVLSKQVLRSGTAIGALISEAEFGQSKADFSSKMSIALKEANESIYWLSLLNDAEYIDQKMYLSLLENAKELTAMLVATVKTTKTS
jgi:four helix bundle protein